jgi:hypothetical protein
VLTEGQEKVHSPVERGRTAAAETREAAEARRAMGRNILVGWAG